MKEKLTLQDLVDLLAKKAGLTKKEADAFFREFLALITENIFNNEPVKIKDFGTFKLTLINSRESINVNTGEKIEIPAHHKLSFLPDKALKALVNKPFEHFETELLNQEVTFDSVEVEEDELEEIQELDEQPETEEIEIDIAVDEPQLDETPDEEIAEEAQKSDNPSFIYTYTSEKTQSANDIITINVPSQQLIDEMTRAIENVKPTIAPQQDADSQIEAIETEKNEEEEEEEESSTPLEVNKVQEKIEQLRDAIDSLSRISAQSTNPDNSFETTSDVPDEAYMKGIGLNIEEQKIDEIDEVPITIEHESEHNENKDNEPEEVIHVIEKTSSDEEYPSVEEPGVDKDRETYDKEFVSSLPDNTHLSNKEVPTESEPDDLEDEEEAPYYSYNKDSFWHKVVNRLPITIFLLAVIIAGVYLFSKLFEQRQIYDNFSSYQRLTEVDTLPQTTVDKEAPYYQTFDRDPFNSNMLLSDTEGTTDSLQDSDDKEEILLDVDISKNLSIGIVNKAKYLLENRKSSDVPATTPETTSSSSTTKTQTNKPSPKEAIAKVEVTPGASLRSIAGKYYGNGALWVYIYEENKDKMKGYDNLRVGQIITIPDLQKYNTSADDPKAVEKAKELERKIFSERR